MNVVRIGLGWLACSWLLIAAETSQVVADAHCDARSNSSRSERDVPSNESVNFTVSGQTRFVMRRLSPPEGAIDFRILGESGAPAILSLIGPQPDHYADYTYNGSDADIDVSHGGLNLRPLDGTGSVNVWSMSGNTRLRIGSRDFRQSLDLWHSGLNAHMRSTNGNIVIESRIETLSTTVLGGNTSVKGTLRVRPGTPPWSSSACEAGQVVWDADFVYVCTEPDRWKRAGLTTY